MSLSCLTQHTMSYNPFQELLLMEEQVLIPQIQRTERPQGISVVQYCWTSAIPRSINIKIITFLNSLKYSSKSLLSPLVAYIALCD